MCGRYYIDDDEGLRLLLREKEAWPSADERLGKRGEIFPSDPAPLLLPGGRVVAGRWGFSVARGEGLVINARQETAEKKPTFRRAMREGRCLAVASYYFEWEKQGKKKQKYALGAPGGEPLTFAGLYRPVERDWPENPKQSADPGLADGAELRFVILTRPAWSGIAFIHDRMPVILPPELREAWLEGEGADKLFCRAQQVVAYRPL